MASTSIILITLFLETTCPQADIFEMIKLLLYTICDRYFKH